MTGQSHLKHIISYGFSLLMRQAESNRKNINLNVKENNQQLQLQIQSLKEEIYNLTSTLETEERIVCIKVKNKDLIY
jgi:hypothetical protein